jgi:hypothetical protein
VEGGDDVVVVATVEVVVLDRTVALFDVDELHALPATSNTTAHAATRKRRGTSS